MEVGWGDADTATLHLGELVTRQTPTYAHLSLDSPRPQHSDRCVRLLCMQSEHVKGGRVPVEVA